MMSGRFVLVKTMIHIERALGLLAADLYVVFQERIKSHQEVSGHSHDRHDLPLEHRAAAIGLEVEELPEWVLPPAVVRGTLAQDVARVLVGHVGVTGSDVRPPASLDRLEVRVAYVVRRSPNRLRHSMLRAGSVVARPHRLLMERSLPRADKLMSTGAAHASDFEHDDLGLQGGL